MALSKQPDVTPINPQTPPKARDDLYRSAVVDEQYNSQLGLENYAAGYGTEVEYYEQILGEHDEQAAFQETRDNAGQQYRRIRKMRVKLQGGMTASFDGEKRRFAQQGSLVMPALVVPKVGDMFWLTGLDHRVVVYSITQVIPKNMSLAPAYECEIAFQYLLTEDRKQSFENKIVEDTIYDADQLKHGKHPVMATIKYNRKYDYLRTASDLIQIYYQEFYNRQINTLLIPDQGLEMYDPWCVRAFNRIWSAIDGKQSRRFQQLNVDDNQLADAKSVFELAMDKNAFMESQLTVEFALVHYGDFFQYPQTAGVRFTGVRGVMWPIDGFQSCFDLKPSVINEPKNPFIKPDIKPVPLIYVPDDDPEQRLYPLVTEDMYYVFTEAFYAKTDKMSVIEGMVRNLIEEKPVSHPKLKELVDAVPLMGALERYYFTPFILMLLRAGAIEP